jgi:6-pyruvoyltetrahydropterin/6-carboxytetrahydropterin synthase
MNNKGIVTCTRRIKFCAGHRVMGHENKCATPHGHNYIVEITAESDDLDHIGRIIDFSVLKEKVGGWVDEHWDHTFLICKDDTQTIEALKMVPATKPLFICPFNPTAEEIAKYLLFEIAPKVLEGTGVRISKIVIHETENCSAEARYKSPNDT